MPENLLSAVKVMDLSIHGKESSVITALLNNESVVEAKLGALSVTTAKIAESAVTTAKINDLAVTTGKINDSAVTTGKINDGAVNNAKIASDADIAWTKMTANAAIRGTTQMDGNVTIGDSKVTLNATSGNVGMAGNLTVSGDLIVQGSTTTLNTQEVLVEDKLMQVGFVGGASAPAAAGFSGMSVFNGTDSESVAAAQPALVWDATASSWKFASMTDATTLAGLQKLTLADLDADDAVMATLDVAGDFKAGANNAVTIDGTNGNTVIGGTLSVSGASDFSADLSVLDALDAVVFSVDSATGDTGIDGKLSLADDLKVNTNKFVVTASSGAVAMAGNLTIGDSKVTADATTGAVVAVSFAGNGALLTSLNASNISSGTLADARLTSNVMLRDAAQSVSGAKTFENALLNLQATSGTSAILDVRAIGDASAKLQILANGKIELGGDVNLYRDAADVLKTDDKLVVGGALDATGDFMVGSSKFTVTASSGNTNVAGTLNAAGDLSVATSKFTVAAASGNVYALGTLEVDGAAQLDSTLAVAGNVSVASTKFTVNATSGNVVAAGSVTAASLTTSGNATIGGNLVVNGSVTYVNSTNTAVKDKLIHLNEPEAQLEDTAVPSGYAGISINRGTVGVVERDHAAFVWDEANSRFKAGTLTSDDATLTLADIQVDDLYAANLHGAGTNITGLAASQIAVTPAGNLAANTVAAALTELQGDIDGILGGGSGTTLASLQTEIDNVETALGFNSNGTMTAFTGTNYIDSDTVREALLDLDVAVDGVSDALATHIGLGTDAHDASAISVVAQNSVAQTNVQAALENHEGRLDTIEAKAWRQVVLYSATGGETSLNKNSGEPAIPTGASTQVFIDGRKVFEGASYQYTVAVGGGSISFAALTAGQSVEILYWA